MRSRSSKHIYITKFTFWFISADSSQVCSHTLFTAKSCILFFIDWHRALMYKHSIGASSFFLQPHPLYHAWKNRSGSNKRILCSCTHQYKKFSSLSNYWILNPPHPAKKPILFFIMAEACSSHTKNHLYVQFYRHEFICFLFVHERIFQISTCEKKDEIPSLATPQIWKIYFHKYKPVDD